MVSTQFYELVEDVISTLFETVSRIDNALEANRRLEKEFEHHVLIACKGVGKEKGFESIANSAHGFPDIICTHKESGLKFGIEVKTGRSFRTNGNSIFTKIGQHDLEDIILIFCHTTKPIKISWKRYEDAICNIAITHSPRFVLQMDQDVDKSFFKQIDSSLDEFKKMSMESKMKLVREYYLKKEGRNHKRKWWL